MMEKYFTQLASPDDFSELRAFAIHTFRTTYEHLNDPVVFEQYLERNFGEEQFRTEFENPHSWFYIIKSESDIVAYCKLNILSAQTEETEGYAMEMERIYVKKSFQGQGLGQLLLETFYDKAREIDCDYVWLGVWEKNKKAIDFYQKAGFKKFGEHTFYMGDEAQLDYMLQKDI